MGLLKWQKFKGKGNILVLNTTVYLRFQIERFPAYMPTRQSDKEDGNKRKMLHTEKNRPNVFCINCDNDAEVVYYFFVINF